jgi:hypothetical protein
MDAVAIVVLGVLAVAGVVWYRNRNNTAARTETPKPKQPVDNK